MKQKLHSPKKLERPEQFDVRLGNVLTLRKDIVHPRDMPKGEAVFVGLQHVESNTGRRLGAETVEMSQLTGRKPRFYKGDIVYGYLRPYLNKVWVAEFDGLCSVDQYVYSVNSSLADTEYVAAFMRSPVYLKSAPVEETPGQLPRIRTEEVANVSIPLPSLGAQRRIAARLKAELAEVARARAAVEAQLKAAQLLPAALLRDVFEGADAKRWRLMQLGDVLARIEAGKCVSCVERPAEPTEWGVLKVSALTWGEFRPGENKVLPQDFEIPDGAEVQPGDFLLSRSNTTELVGAVALVRETRPQLMLSDKTLRLVANREHVLPEFLEYALRTSGCRRFIEENATGASSSMKNITQDSIRRIPLPLPSIAEQLHVVLELQTQLGETTRLIEELRVRLMSIRRLPESLLSEAFSVRKA